MSDSQIEKYSDILSPLPDSALDNMDYSDYEQDCIVRSHASVSNFKQTGTGFTATTDYSKDSLVLFSVPYDSGFKATINGNPTTFDNVDNGLIAMRVPAGHNEIIFSYCTPGLKCGIIISILSLIFAVVYIIFSIKKTKTSHKKQNI